MFDLTIISLDTLGVWQKDPTNRCGDPNLDVGSIIFFGTLPHTASSLTVKVGCKTDDPPTDESFGFRDVNLLFSSTSYSSGSLTCSYAVLTSTTQTHSNSLCNCDLGFYKDGATCQSCHASCALCYGPGQTGCIKCQTGYSYDGTKCVSCGTTCITCDITGIGIIDTDDSCRGIFL